MKDISPFNVTNEEELGWIQIDNSYLFFDVVVSFLSGICATNLVIDSYLSKAKPYKEGEYLFFEGRKNATNRIYYLFPFEIYSHIVIHNTWPNSLRLYFKEKTIEDQEYIEGEITGFSKVFLSLGQASYIQYWEAIKPRIINLFGSDQSKWEIIFQFGWIVRNALAHNFRITINNKNIDNVVWNKLNFGYSSNGQDISEHIMFIELIVLMKDIEDRINYLSM